MVDNDLPKEENEEPTQLEAEDAIRTLLRFIGENPDREGLRDTPKRVAKAYSQLFSGYKAPECEPTRGVSEERITGGGMILLRDLPFFSHCEHHMVPIVGKLHVAYLPDRMVAEMEAIAHVVERFTKRLQTQEAITAQIATALEALLRPQGLGILVEASHMCMAMRGIQKSGSSTLTTTFVGSFKLQAQYQAEFMALVRGTSRS